MITYRTLCLSGFLTCAALIATALYFQYVENLEPCPLCIFQRVAFICLGVVFLAGFLHNPAGWGRKAYSGLALLVGLTGAGIAARHIWLQNLPADQAPECGPGLDFMLQAMPFTKMLATVLQGSGECAETLWTLFGISMPGWSLIWLLLLTGLALYPMFGRSNRAL